MSIAKEIIASLTGLAEDLEAGRPVKVTTRPKPRKWNRFEDARCCIACAKEFKRGDDVFPLAACCIHAGCVRLYVEQCKELGVVA